jgi:radical SAM-linked protein
MRIRIQFEKIGALKYIGHLDLHKMWERSARRGNVTLSYSQGFHPQPKIQLASALPLGFSSRAEVVDMWTAMDYETDWIKSALQLALPTGIHVNSVNNIDDALPPLQTEVIAAEFEVDFTEFDFSQLAEAGVEMRVAKMLSIEEIIRERRGKTYNLRPLIEFANYDATTKIMTLRLTAKEGATGRPEEVLAELGIPFEEVLIERSAILFR